MTSHVEAERLARFADGLIDPADEQELRAHIDQCESCFEAWSQEFLPLLAEGLVEAADEQTLREHMAVCAQCSATWAEYSEAVSAVPDLLAEARYPPLANDTSRSLSALLQAESDLTDAEHDTTSNTESHESISESADSGADAATAEAPLPFPHRATRKRATRWMPYLVAAAAAVFLLGGGAAVLQATLGTEPPTELNGAAPPDEIEDADEAPEAVLPAQPRLVASGTDYTTTNLDSAAAEVLNQAQLPAPGETEDTTETEDELPVPEPEESPEDEAVVACVEMLDTPAPVLIDVATYAGEPAWMMAAPEGDDDDYLVHVVTPGCPSGDSDLLAETTVPRT